MKSVSLRKFSILGVVLIAASAVTAAILPSNSKTAAELQDQNGTWTPSADNVGGQTCKPPSGAARNCINTATGDGSANTGAGQTSNQSTD